VSDRPRVLVLAGGMVTHGGAERMMFSALRALHEKGAAIHCILNGWEYDAIAQVAEHYGFTWSTSAYRVRLNRRTRSPRAIGAQLADIWQTNRDLLAEARRFRPTHVLVPAHDTTVRNFPALAILRARGVRVVMKMSNAPAPTPFYRRLWRWGVSPVVSLFVCNSGFTRRELLACGIPERKTTLLYETLPDRPEAPVAEAPVPGRIVFVGQVIPEKGLHLLLDAVALLLARGLDVHLDVVGKVDGWMQPSYGTYRDDLLLRAAAPDLQRRVSLLGWRENVLQAIAAGSIHCCPSLPIMRESFGLVVLEAKTAGRPSVVCPSGALIELVTHQVDGWICPEPTAEALADGLSWFLSDPARLAAASEAARASASRFNRHTFDRGWQELFFTLAPGSALPAPHAR